MTNIEALRHLKKYFMGSKLWNKLRESDKYAIEKGCVALENMYYGKWKVQIDNGSPIGYYTNGVVKIRKDLCGDVCVYVDDRLVFHTLHANDSSRGQRHEVVIYDNTVDEKVLHEVIEPTIRGDGLEIHNAYDFDRWVAIDREQRELIKES
jgi:hypothetical protein